MYKKSTPNGLGKHRETLEDIGIGNYFLNRALIVQEIRARVDKWDWIKFKSLCTSKETITRIDLWNGRKSL
jgi:hypothetical protein